MSIFLLSIRLRILNMDISFKNDEARFNCRVAAIIYNNTLLVMKDEQSPYYYIIGNRVRMN
ncbi:hypothetical protein UT300018_18230 [Clostridium faecium]